MYWDYMEAVLQMFCILVLFIIRDPLDKVTISLMHTLC